MFSPEIDLLEIKENEQEFINVCTALKNHQFESPWRMCFKQENKNEFINEIFEFSCSEYKDILIEDVSDSHMNIVNSAPNPTTDLNVSQSESIQEKDVASETEINAKMGRLKDSLMVVQETSTVNIIKDIDILYTIPVSEVPVLCSMLDISVLTETALVLFLNAVLHLDKPISLATAAALIHHLVCPKISEMKNASSRVFITSILDFVEIYPKAVIDEIMIPCSGKEVLVTLQSEILFKMVKSSLPNEYISYCIKSLLEHAIPTENTFSLLQCLIDRKVPHESSVFDALTKKMQVWAITCNNNLKFTKLLTSILSVYGFELTREQILVYDDVIQNNKTIVKKAAGNLLKKLKAGAP